MQTTQKRITLALVVLGTGLAAAQAQAVQISLFGGSNIGNLTTVTGTDGLGNQWQTRNAGQDSSNFAMADFNASVQPFNVLNFSNGFGTFANSFQITINNSQFGVGFRGIDLGAAASGLVNAFIVKPDALDASTWTTWMPTYTLFDTDSGLFQRVLFTAPTGTQLSQGTGFSVNVNFAGIMTADSGWSASFSDRMPATAVIPVPGSLLLLGAGLLGMGMVSRRRKA